MAVGLHKPHIPWIMPQRFLDMQPPANSTDTALHDTPPVGYVNASLYQCTNIDKQVRTPHPPLPLVSTLGGTGNIHCPPWGEWLVLQGCTFPQSVASCCRHTLAHARIAC